MPKLQGKRRMKYLITTGRCINNNYGFDKLQPLFDNHFAINFIWPLNALGGVRYRADEMNEASYFYATEAAKYRKAPQISIITKYILQFSVEN